MRVQPALSPQPTVEGIIRIYLGSAFGERLDDMHHEFKDTGYLALPDFAPRPIQEAVRSEVLELLDHHAKRREILVPATGNTPRYYESVGRDAIATQGRVIPAFYRSEAFMGFLAALAGETVIPIPYEPEEMLITRMTQPGDNHGWHWDDYSFSFCWLVEAPPLGCGGDTEMVPNTHWDKEDPRVEHYLATREIRRGHHPTDTAYFLRADTTMHRVNPITEGSRRIVLVLSYGTLADLDKDVSHETIETIYT